MSLEITVRRNFPTKRSTTGQMTIDGTHQCVTLEPPPTPDPDGNHFICIPAGQYQVTIRWSPKFGKAVPHVERVPGRTAIEIHVGNTPSDTDGCTLVGEDYGYPSALPDYIRNSAATFSFLMGKLYSSATLINPDDAEQDQVWNVGTITYEDALAESEA